MNATAELLTKVIGPIAVTQLVSSLSHSIGVYSYRPVLTVADRSKEAMPMEYRLAA